MRRLILIVGFGLMGIIYLAMAVKDATNEDYKEASTDLAICALDFLICYLFYRQKPKP